MKKNVRKRKKKKINRYIPILASGLLIALTVLVISWVFSARRTYTVVILKEGAEQEYAQYHSLAQAKEEMLTQTTRAEKQNAGIRYDHKLIAIGFSQRQAVAILYGVAALLGFCAVLITADSFVKAMMIIGVAFVFILLGAFVLYRREKKAEKEPQQEDSSEQN